MATVSFNTRIELPLHDAVKLALSSVGLRAQGILHNLFYIVDKPGAGKTMCIGHDVRQHGWGFLPYSPALERLEKLGGIPDLYWTYKDTWEASKDLKTLEKTGQEKDQLRTIWSVPQMITEINDAAAKYPYVVVLFDDWHLCDEDLQKIGFEVFTYYKLNNNPIADNVIFILAGNESSAAGAKVQMSAIRNRVTFINSRADVKNWLSNFAIPSGIHPMGISFFNNPMNHDLFQEAESSNEQFGSPRSWTSLFNILSFIEKTPSLWVEDEDYNLVLPRQYIYAVVQGSVSRVATERFMMHYDIYKEVDMDDFFDNGNVAIPDNPVNRYCYCTAITYEFYSRYVQEKDKTKQKLLSDLYIRMINALKMQYRELVSAVLVNLGHIPENATYGYQAGILIIGDMVRNKSISMDLVREIQGITKILDSAR